LQATAEQMRLAKMMEHEDPEIKKKIIQVTELTGRSADDAMTALHDCDYDLNHAVEQLLDSENNQVCVSSLVFPSSFWLLSELFDFYVEFVSVSLWCVSCE
jgi:hypothetical protein